jgi:hypothetical protein
MISANRLVFLGFFAILATSVGGHSAHAAAADPACDPNFMTTLKERAWMEAQREMVMNETFIWKPDSVLALSCFSGTLSTIPIGFASGNPLQQASKNAADWIGSNFWFDLGGGNTSIVHDASKTPNNCKHMYDLWKEAKCEVLGGNLDDVFVTFTDFAGGKEPRIAPEACTNTPSAEFTKYLADMGAIGLAYGGGGGTPVGFDSINLFLGVTAPVTDAAVTKCNAGIITGIKVTVGGSSVDEIVCSNPGCSPTTGGAGGALRCCPVDASGAPNPAAKCSN